MFQIQNQTHTSLPSPFLVFSYFFFIPSFYADPVPGLKRVWRIRYTTQPVRKTGWVGGGREVDGGGGLNQKKVGFRARFRVLKVRISMGK
jgi:hypothetical protein